MPLDFISAHWTSWWYILLLFFSWIEKLILKPLLCSSLDSKFLCWASSPYFFLFYISNYFALLVTFLSDLISLYHFSRYMVLYFVIVPFLKPMTSVSFHDIWSQCLGFATKTFEVMNLSPGVADWYFLVFSTSAMLAISNVSRFPSVLAFCLYLCETLWITVPISDHAFCCCLWGKCYVHTLPLNASSTVPAMAGESVICGNYQN